MADLKVHGTPAVYDVPSTLTYAADCTPDCADGLFRKITLTGNIEINPPVDCCIEGCIEVF